MLITLPIEMVLTRQCAVVSKLMYHLWQTHTSLCERLVQQRPAGSLLVAGYHGRHLRRAGPPHGAWVSLPAFVASRIMCRPLVSIMVGASWPSMTRAPTKRLRALSPLRSKHPLPRKRLKIQALIAACVDTGVHQGLLQMRENEGSWGAQARLLELGDAEIDHTWMWHLNPHPGSVLEPEEFIGSVRLRLGCAGPCEPVPCAACQSGFLDTATCCALGEATRGHNVVTALVHATAQSCDCAVETEVPGLIPGIDLRPADVLTSHPWQLVHRPRHLDLLSTQTRPLRPAPPLSARTFPAPRSSGAPTGDLTETR